MIGFRQLSFLGIQINNHHSSLSRERFQVDAHIENEYLINYDVGYYGCALYRAVSIFGGYCHGLPEEDPFYYPLYGGRSKEAIFSDCLSQMSHFRFYEALKGFEEWQPKMLQKQRVDTPDKLKNASHRSQYALCESLKDYCQAVLSMDPGMQSLAKERILSERGLTRSMKEKFQSLFLRMEEADRE